MLFSLGKKKVLYTETSTWFSSLFPYHFTLDMLLPSLRPQIFPNTVDTSFNVSLMPLLPSFGKSPWLVIVKTLSSLSSGLGGFTPARGLRDGVGEGIRPKPEHLEIECLVLGGRDLSRPVSISRGTCWYHWERATVSFVVLWARVELLLLVARLAAVGDTLPGNEANREEKHHVEKVRPIPGGSARALGSRHTISASTPGVFA